MPKYAYLLIISLLCLTVQAQQKVFLLRDIRSGTEFKSKDSAQAVKFLDSLAENNFYFTKVTKVTNREKTVQIDFDKGQNYNHAAVTVPDSLAKTLKIKNQFFTKNLDSVRKEISLKIAESGYSFGRVRTRFGGMKDGIPQVALSAVPGRKRIITGIVIKGYDKLPKRFTKNIQKNFLAKDYSQKAVEELRKSLEGNRFITQEKPPQTLFTRDSTNLYIFLTKRKASSFDGIVGFGNDKSKKISFNGSLDVNFANIFNKFEEISIFWQRNPDRGQTFNLQTDVPYLGGSNIGLNVRANIFRQDSAYANARILPSVYYHISQNQKAGVKLNFETSSVTQQTSGSRNFTKKGIGLWYELFEPIESPLLLFRTKINVDLSTVKATYSDQNLEDSQISYLLSGERNFNFGGNHWLNLKIEAAKQGGKSLATNEMLKFGGWNSMRGFAENSLLANSYAYTNLEYRYLIGAQAFFDLFGQYGEFSNNSLSVKPKIYSVGLGFHFFLPIGLMSFQISNGSEAGNPFKFSGTKIHWGILSRF